MNIDFHTHAKLSKKVEFSLEYFEEMAQIAVERGIDAIALTEHFNTKNFYDVYETLNTHFPMENDYYKIHGLKVFPGMEVDVFEVGHILCIGRLQDVLALRKQLDQHTEKDKFVTFKQLLDLCDQYNFLVIGAHPFRESTPLVDKNPDLLKRLDAFDLNGKDLHTRGIEQNINDLQHLAKLIGIPVVGGSDTHQYMQYGVVYTNLPKECMTVKELKEAVTSNQFEVTVANDLHEKVEEAIRLKKIAKEMLQCK